MINKVYVVVVEEYTTDWNELVGAWVVGVYVNVEDAIAEVTRLDNIQDECYMAYIADHSLKVKAKSDANN